MSISKLYIEKMRRLPEILDIILTKMCSFKKDSFGFGTWCNT